MVLFRHTCVTVLLLTGCVSGGLRAPNYVSSHDLGESPSDFADEPLPSARGGGLPELLDRPALDFADLLTLADLHNPEIAAARHALGAAAGRTWQAELYANPTLELEAEDVSADHISLGRSQNTVSVTQPVILGGRRSAAVSAASAEQVARRLALEAKRREIHAEVRLVHVDLLSSRQARLLYEELLDIARQTLHIAQTRFEARAAPEVEVVKSEIEVHELHLATRRLQRESAAAGERLRALLGGVEVPTDRLVGDLTRDLRDVDLARLRALVTSSHPAVLAAEREVEAANYRIAVAEAERYPDLGIRLAYGRDTAADENLVEAGISVPLPLFDRNQGKILEARHMARLARQQAAALADRLSTELAAAHAAYATARDAVETFEVRVVPAADRAFSQAKDGYTAGRASLLDLLDAQRTLAGARLSLLQSLREAHLAYSQLWSLAGPSLED